MAVYGIADLHLALGDPKKSMAVFGGRWTGYADKIRENWQNTVKETDTVVIAGDISWALSLSEARADFEFLHALPGRKILLKGNHDFFFATRKKMEDFFTENGFVFEILHNNAIPAEDKILCGSRGWYTEEKNVVSEADSAKMVAREVLRLERSLEAGKALQQTPEGAGRELAALLHFPPLLEDYACPPLLEVLSRYGVRRCYFGHIHGRYDLPPVTEKDGVEYHLISGDYLDFVPKKID